jgi:methyl-accepting chemotaxis protein
MVGANPARLISVARRLADGEPADLNSLGKIPEGSMADAVTRSAVAIETSLGQVDDVMGALAQGDFSGRVDTTEKRGRYLQIAHSINSSCQQLDDVLGATTRAAGQLAAGDLGTRLEMQAEGRFLVLRDSINSLRHSLRNFIQMQDGALAAARDGDTSHRIASTSPRCRASRNSWPRASTAWCNCLARCSMTPAA